MTIDDLLERVRAQPEVREGRIVNVWGPELRADVEARRMITLADIAKHPDQSREIRAFRYGHVVGRPLTLAQISEWQKRFPGHPLPRDLVDLLLRLDGLHLWADLEQGRAYFG